MRTARITRTFTIHPTPAELAAEFCELNHDEQAKVLVDIARTIQGYETMARNMVPLLIGRELYKLPGYSLALEMLRDVEAYCKPKPTSEEPF